MLTRRSLLVAPMIATALAPLVYKAQADDFPSGPITFVVSFPAGGSIDVVMRAVAAKLQMRLGKPVVIENRAGAGGAIATGAVVKAAPDGLTLLAAASSLAANPTLLKTLPFDTVKDLQAISHDQHLRVQFFRGSAPPTPQSLTPSPGQLESERQDGLHDNFGFVRARRLPGRDRVRGRHYRLG